MMVESGVWATVSAFILLLDLVTQTAFGQIDPFKRDLFQFVRTNLTLRLAIAPTYLDSELGISDALGPHTDIGIAVAGGGFADSYQEVRRGTFLPSESFSGYGAEGGLSVYHLFNPEQQIPLNGVLRGLARYSTYDREDETAANFQVPKNRTTFSVRTGLRLAGQQGV